MAAKGRVRERRRLVLALGLGVLLGLIPAFFLLRDHRPTRDWIKLHLRHPFDRADTLDLARASELFDLPQIREGFRYDPVAWLLNRPNVETTWVWPEHPAGRFTLRTNELGLNEDDPTPLRKGGVRILVAGDSHTAGLVDNRESYANVCETILREQTEGGSFEVLNAGVAYTGPSCYARVFEKFLDLEPDVFVATLFTGNDFADELRLRYLLDGWSWPSGSAEYRGRVQEGAESFPGPMGQGFNQTLRWKEHPDEAERSLQLAVGAYRGIQARCEAEGVAFLAVVLPTKMDVDAEGEEARTLHGILGLHREDLAVNRALGERFAAALRSEGIVVLEPLDAMAEAEAPLYWTKDYHLNVAGHALLARLLVPVLRELLEER